MPIFCKNPGKSLFVCITGAALLLGCGNKGDLYLDTRESLIEQINSIDDALDELEAMEADEEERKS